MNAIPPLTDAELSSSLRDVECTQPSCSDSQSHAKRSQSSCSVSLDEVLGQGVWRASHAPSKQYASVETGFSALNAQLALGGWPLGVTTEIGLSEVGIGELRLLLPGLRQLLNDTQQGAHVVMIAPPYELFAPALQALGLEPSRITLVKASSITEVLWAAEQALVSTACTAVITWGGEHDMDHRALRRLQLAAEKTRCWHVLFRQAEMLSQSSISGLRMRLETDHYSRLKVAIVKQPQGWAGQECVLSLPPHYERWQRLSGPLLPHHNRWLAPRVRVLAKAPHRSASETAVNPRCSVVHLPCVV